MPQMHNGAPAYSEGGPYVASLLCKVPRCRRRGHLYTVYAGGRAIDFPIRYGDGRIVYDWPERVPARAKRLVGQAIAIAREED